VAGTHVIAGGKFQPSGISEKSQEKGHNFLVQLEARTLRNCLNISKRKYVKLVVEAHSLLPSYLTK
jgi:hypothetical protein